MFKLGFVSAILPTMTLEELVEFAAMTGYRCLELMCWPQGAAERRYAGVTHIDVGNLDRQNSNNISKMFSDKGLEISGLGYYPNPLTPDREEAESCVSHLKKVIVAADMLDVPVVNTFIGRDWTRSVEGNWTRFCEVWPPLVKFAGEHGVNIAIENCPMLFTEDEWPGGKNLAHCPAVWRRMFAEIPDGNFGLNFDPSHFVWQQMDYLKAMYEFADRIFHVHLKDARLDRERLEEVGILATPLKYHTPKLPGFGDVNWGRFFSVLSDVGYNGAVCVEVEDRAFEGSLEMRQAALEHSRNYLRQYMADPD